MRFAPKKLKNGDDWIGFENPRSHKTPQEP